MASRAFPWLAALLLAGCATLAVSHFDNLFGPPDPNRFDTPAVPLAGDASYVQTIQPILDRRCVVCHACYDAPCQLKATSWEGLARGASKTAVYDATRLLAAAPSRLYVDAQKPSEWRKRDFFAVFNERVQTPEASRSVGLMHRMLLLKQQHPWPGKTAHAALDLSPNRASMCPTEGEMEAYEHKVPQGGMPFGLPGLSAEEHARLTGWLEKGAPYEGPIAPPAGVTEQVALWERFFNGDSLKEQLFARYAYEHLFLAHLYFEDDAERHYFKLVRSATPPGQPLRIIATSRPVDDPKVSRVYYRLERERETIVAKTHLPYVLNAKRMARWRELFFKPDYRVDKLPGYSEETAANPFATFADLPVNARYRFMLDEAEFTIMGFIKGPVCRGQLALNVIEDQFWVTFLAPSDDYDNAVDKLLQKDAHLTTLPTGSNSSSILLPWIKYGQLAASYQKARTELMNRKLKADGVNLGLIWDGDGNNANAALTVFRHFDSASVVKGLVGDPPKSSWVIGYPLLERIHYLLVANYDVYGNLGHQTNSRLYMDYLRAEGEFNFLAFLPKSQRIATRDYWYRNVDEATREQVYGGAGTTLEVDSGIRYGSGDARLQFYGLLKQRLAPALDMHLDWQRNAPAALQPALKSLAMTHGAALQWMPETAILVIDMPDRQQAVFTLIRNTAHASVSHLLGEAQALLPAENTFTLTSGIVGSYPNAFYRLKASELPALTSTIKGLQSEQDYAALTRRWAVRRDNPDFWAFSDNLLARYARDEPIASGILDYNRMEFR